jgi:hypothetical protein
MAQLPLVLLLLLVLPLLLLSLSVYCSPMGPHSSTGSPMTFMMRPSVPRPTGTCSKHTSTAHAQAINILAVTCCFLTLIITSRS